MYAIVASTGVILAAVYLLWSYQRIFFGKNERPENQALRDLSVREIAVLVPVVLFIVWIGVYPGITPAMLEYVLESFHAIRA